MSQHTPGPWKVYKDCVLTDCPDAAAMLRAGKCVTTRRICEAEASHYVPPQQNEANLRLIAAAPDLLASLQEVLSLAVIKWGNLDPDANSVFESARAAIAKSEGKRCPPHRQRTTHPPKEQP